MTKKSIYILLATVLFLTALSSCKSSRQTVSSTGEGQSGMLAGTFDLKECFETVPTEWNTIQVPLTISLAKPTSFKASAKVYMTRDTSIYMSFTVLGMEMAAIQITNDSIFGVDKMHKQYVAESLESITANYPVNVSTLQQMFMGEPCMPVGNKLSEKNFTINPDYENGQWVVTPKKQFSPFKLSYSFNVEKQLEQINISSPASDFTLKYADRAEFLNKFVPQSDIINVITKKLKVEATLKWNWNKARVNNPSDNRRIKINPSYRRISALDLLKSYS